MKRILLLEDDQSFGYILSEYLSLKLFHVTWVKRGEEALEILNNEVYDLAILDLMLPGIDGFEVAKEVKLKHKNLPFIFLSAKSLKIDQLKGYQHGAIDYVTKPIDEEILLAKIHAIINQKESAATIKEEELVIGTFRFRPDTQELIGGSGIKKLTTRESDLLYMLASRQNQLTLRKEALQQIWGATDEFSRKSMDVFISHLRKYLSSDPSIKIENVHGKGFVMKILA